MGLPQQVASIYQRLVNSNNVRFQRWPNAAAGTSITSGATPAFSAWTQIVAAAVIANPAWLAGVFLENAATAGAAEVWLVDLATGAPGSEVSISSGTNAAQGFGTITQHYETAVGSSLYNGYLPLTAPIKTTGAPRITAALAGLVTGGKAAYVAFQTATGIGT